MVIVAFAILGVAGMFQWSDYGLRQGINGTQALAMVEARLEAKRNAHWDALLVDDLDADGTAETAMRDDGQREDQVAGDGIYTASTEKDGVHLYWTVRLDRSSPLPSAGSATIEARARYQIGEGRWKEIRLGTIRANPRYVGAR